MQHVLIYLSLFFVVSAMQGQTKTVNEQNKTAPTQYGNGMREAFGLWKDNKPWEAANLFERIAKAEPGNWLPPYYVAQINVIYSFGEKDENKLSEQLGKAQDYINDATAISKDNPDLLALQALLYTAWIVYDGRQYGMEYSPKASALYEKALALAPENPRMIMARAEWNIGSTKYFGGSVEPYCKEIKQAIELSDNFGPEPKFYPRFNKERAEQVIAENCN